MIQFPIQISNLRLLAKDKLIIFVTHDLSMLKMADSLIFAHEGCFYHDSYTNLISNNSYFYDFVNSRPT